MFTTICLALASIVRAALPANGHLTVECPSHVHELQILWVAVRYPMEPSELRKWTRPSLAGNPYWPNAEIELEAPPGNALQQDYERITDPDGKLAPYSTNRHKGGQPRTGESFPLQLITGSLGPGKYRVTVGIPGARRWAWAAESPNGRVRTKPFTGSAEFEVVATTEQQRAGVLSDARKAIKEARAGGRKLGFAELAPLLLEGSEPSLTTVFEARDARDRRLLAHLFHVILMRDQNREKVVRVALECVKGGQNVNSFFEEAAQETLYYRAAKADLPAVLNLLDTGTEVGRHSAISLAGHICNVSEISWSPSPHTVASQVADLSDFRARVEATIRSSETQPAGANQ